MNFIKNMLEYASTKTGINYEKMCTYCKLYASDKRYKPMFKAATCTWSYNETGIISYRGRDYYYRQDGINNVIVEYR